MDGRVFDRVTLPGYASTGLPGHPELPQIGVSLGIPAEGEVTVKVLDAKEEDLPGTYTVLPASAWTVQRDPQTGQAVAEAGVQAEFALDAGIYAQDSFMPIEVATLDETAFVRQQRIARVTLHPVQVNPARAKSKYSGISELRYPSRQPNRSRQPLHPLPSPRMLLTLFCGISFSTLSRLASGRRLARPRVGNIGSVSIQAILVTLV